MNIGPDQVLPLAAAMIMGSLGLSLLAALGAAVTVGLRRGGIAGLAPDPAALCAGLIFGVAASAPAAGHGRIGQRRSLLILAALVARRAGRGTNCRIGGTARSYMQ